MTHSGVWSTYSTVLEQEGVTDFFVACLDDQMESGDVGGSVNPGEVSPPSGESGSERTKHVVAGSYRLLEHGSHALTPTGASNSASAHSSADTRKLSVGVDAVAASAVGAPSEFRASEVSLPEIRRKRLRIKTRSTGEIMCLPASKAARGPAVRLSLPPPDAVASEISHSVSSSAAMECGQEISVVAGLDACPHQAESAEQVPESSGVWEGFDEQKLNSPRAMYFYVFKKIKSWVEDEVSGLSQTEQRQTRGHQLIRLHKQWRTASCEMKNRVVGEFLAVSNAPPAVKAWAGKTWPTESSSAGDQEGGALAINGRTVLLTYQGPWGNFDDECLPVCPREEDLPVTEDPYRRICVRLRLHEPLQKLWEEFQQHGADLRRRFCCDHTAASCELCTKTYQNENRIKVHFHLVLKKSFNMKCKCHDRLSWRGVVPHISHGIWAIQQRACNGWAGMYYLQCPKLGMVISTGSKAPFTDFPVNPDWIFTLLAAEKMSLASARPQIVRCGKGLTRRLADLDRLGEARRQLALESRVQEIQRCLASSASRFRKYPTVLQWLKDSSAGIQRRKRFLVLEGPSGIGKTEYVRSLHGASRTLELNCASCGTSPDLRQHNPEVHRLVLFDEGSPEMVLHNRKVFQAPAAILDLGHSPTGRDVYRVWLNDSVLVVNSNRWSADVRKQSVEDREWLEANQVLVVVTTPMWEEGPSELDSFTSSQ